MGKFADVNFEDKDANFRVSYSGGKDSSAMLLMLLEKGYPVTSVDFMDVGWEYPEIYEYLDKVDNFIFQNYGMRINKMPLKKEWQFDRWFYGNWSSGKNEGKMRGFPRVLGRCYLSRQKARTLDRYDRTSYRYIGIGWNERHRESDKPLLLYPLIEWQVTEDDCVEYLKSRGMFPDHRKYYKRTGCWWCPKQSIGSARSLYIRHPDLWKQLKILEAESPVGWNTPGKTTYDLENRFEREIAEGIINLDDYK